MLEVVRSETIRCAPDDWLDLVLDVHRYATLDDKMSVIDAQKDEFAYSIPTKRLPLFAFTTLDSRFGLIVAVRAHPDNMASVGYPLNRQTVRNAVHFFGTMLAGRRLRAQPRFRGHSGR